VSRVAWTGRLRPLLAEKLALTVGLTLLWSALWILVPRYATVTAHALPLTWIEREVPFVEPFVYVYLSICLFMPLGPFLTVSRPMLLRHGRGFLGITLVGFACFVLYPVAVPVPDVVPETLLYQLILSDTRLNSLPSLHAAYTVYSLLYWRCLLPTFPSRQGERGCAGARSVVAALVTGWACLILASIFLIKQHYVLDVVAGIALAGVAHRLVARKMTARPAVRLARFTPTPEVES
jgi:hypothetical protein